jgi:hypothetical protein
MLAIRTLLIFKMLIILPRVLQVHQLSVAPLSEGVKQYTPPPPQLPPPFITLSIVDRRLIATCFRLRL